MNNQYKKILLLLGDIAVLYLSLYLTLLIRYQAQPSANTWYDHFLPFSLTFVAWLIIFYISDLYNLHLAVNNSRFFNLTIRSVVIAGLLSALFFYINPNIEIAPKTNLAIYLVVFAILFMLWRRLYNWILYSRLPKDKLIFIGYNEKVKELENELKEKPHLGFSVAEIISDNISDLKKIIKEKNISTVVLASDPHDSEEIRKQLFSCLSLNVNILNLTDFYENVTGRIPIDTINQMWFLEKLSQGKKTVFDTIKRICDFILALIILIITS